MRKYFPILIAVILVLSLVFTTGCLPSSSGSKAPVVSATDKTQNDKLASQNNEIVELKNKLDLKANSASVKELKDDLDALKKKVSDSSTDNTYTKAEVDKLIKALKDNQDWITASTSSSSSSSNSNDLDNDYGDLLDKDGVLEVWLQDMVDPGSVPIALFNSTSESIKFDIVVVNRDSNSNRYNLDIMLYADDDRVEVGTPELIIYPRGGTDWSFDVTKSDKTVTIESVDHECTQSILFRNNAWQYIRGDSADEFSVRINLSDINNLVGNYSEWDLDLSIRERY